MKGEVAPCPHRPPCPGCPRYGEPGPPKPALAALAALAEEAGIDPPTVRTAPAPGSRHRARLMVRGRARSPKIGLFQAGSHRIVDIPRCGLHHPLVNEVAAAARHAIRASGLAPYADRPHTGVVRALQVVVERPTGRAQVVWVTCDETPERVAPLLVPFREALREDRLAGLFWNGNPERTPGRSAWACSAAWPPSPSTSRHPEASRGWPSAWRSARRPSVRGPGCWKAAPAPTRRRRPRPTS